MITPVTMRAPTCLETSQREAAEPHGRPAAVGVALVSLLMLAAVLLSARSPGAARARSAESTDLTLTARGAVQGTSRAGERGLTRTGSMEEFFRHPGVRLRQSRDWSGHAVRSWFTVDPSLPRKEIRTLLDKLPVGASVQFFDVEHPQVSDPGAFVTITRRPEEWTVAWANHGWSSREVPVTFERAVQYFATCCGDDWGMFLSGRSSRELMAHHAPAEALTGDILRGSENVYQDYLNQRLGQE